VVLAQAVSSLELIRYVSLTLPLDKLLPGSEHCLLERNAMRSVANCGGDIRTTLPPVN
jgi:hypothetical protein